MLGFLAAGKERGAESAGCPALSPLKMGWRISAIFGFIATARLECSSPAKSKRPFEFE
jgi:hypothetical protein